MKSLVILSLCIILTLSFKFSAKSQAYISSGLDSSDSNLQMCSNAQTNTLYSAIANCEVANINTTISCMKNYFVTALGQNWDIYATGPYGQSGVCQWVYGDCRITLANYGKYSRYYLSWQSVAYSSKNSKKTNEEIIKTEKISQSTSDANVKILGDCASNRLTAVNNAVASCDNRSNLYDASTCVVNMLYQNLNYENWNAYVAPSTGTDAGVVFWSFDDCNVQITNYGPNQRTYLVWKAKSS